MKTFWRSMVFVVSALGRIIGVSIGGACLGGVIGGLEGLLIGPFAFLLLFVRGGFLSGGSFAFLGGRALAYGTAYGPQVFAAFGVVVGAFALALVQGIHIFSAQRESLLRFDLVCGIAARCGLLCGFCAALTGVLSPYSYEFPSGGLSVEGSILGWSAGFIGGAVWSRIAVSRPKVSFLPLDVVIGWLWGEP